MQKYFATAILLATQTFAASDFLHILKGLDENEPDIRESHPEKAREGQLYEKRFGEWGKHQEEGLDLVLSESLNNKELVCPLYGPGCWSADKEKSGVVKTIIPAREILTETYTTECETGATKDCYQIKECESQTWNLCGNIDQSIDWCGKGCGDDKTEIKANGGTNEFGMACGNYKVLPLDDECHEYIPNKSFTVQMPDFQVNVPGDIEATITSEVEDQITEAISEMISKAVAYAISEGIRDSISLSRALY